ncbi:hypothetical protein KIN20_015243 [Parelaphostrongylus tenuis]|uniref:Metalloendopeptidase n=1 Tax=Parelaphostrongylus tenuis TaxID=148309 RepID=A0AAD5N0F6_PARTN|nr:hypothetical protein KIN20_015243 [Parelaphostrongylus tenuis]
MEGHSEEEQREASARSDQLSRTRNTSKHKIVQHELLHIVGLYHEHARYDRDKYIKIHSGNIKPDRFIAKGCDT